jgi:hypothetical protein
MGPSMGIVEFGPLYRLSAYPPVVRTAAACPDRWAHRVRPHAAFRARNSHPAGPTAEALPLDRRVRGLDINGFDPFIHHGTARGALRAVAEAFDRPSGSPPMSALVRIYRTLRTIARELKAQDGADTVFNRRHFGQLVLAGQQTAVRLGLIPRRR